MAFDESKDDIIEKVMRVVDRASEGDMSVAYFEVLFRSLRAILRKEKLMAFDESKDITVGEWKREDLMVSLRQYNGGAVKFQVGPREAEKADGSLTHRKAGRLTIDEVEWLVGELPKILAAAQAL